MEVSLTIVLERKTIVLGKALKAGSHGVPWLRGLPLLVGSAGNDAGTHDRVFANNRQQTTANAQLVQQHLWHIGHRTA